MLIDWIYWLSSVPLRDWWLLLLPLMFFDTLRYTVSLTALWVYDFFSRCFRMVFGQRPETFAFTPSVTIVIAGLNEAEALAHRLDPIYNNYPGVQMIIVDDGSTDGMGAVAQAFADRTPNVIAISKPRGGKSSALNAALPYALNEHVVVVDADSELGENAIYEILQPLQDPTVGAVSGNVLAHNRKQNLLTVVQGFEYQRSIFLGRMVSARLGILGIISGAFGVFRLSLLKELGGWDVGPGEDEDIVLRMRKMGYRVEFAPYAECYSDVPTKLKVLTKQRRRWEWAVVTFESRKHIEMAKPTHANFSFSNLLLFAERWIFNMLLPIAFCVYLPLKLAEGVSQHEYQLLFTYYVLFCFAELLNYLFILDYSNNRRRDYSLVLAVPVMPFYQFYMRFVTVFAIIEEMVSRRSFRDGFVPEHVRQATWHW